MDAASSASEVQYRSSVVKQIEAWIGSAADSRPSILDKPHSPAALQYRLKMLMEPPFAQHPFWVASRFAMAAESKHILGLRSTSTPRRAAPRKTPSSCRVQSSPALAAVDEDEPEIPSFSRVSGRQRKTPGKFKHVANSPQHATRKMHNSAGAKRSRETEDASSSYRPTPLRRGNSYSISERSRKSGASRPHVEEEEEEHVSEVRVGRAFQAQVPFKVAPWLCDERGDTLVWSSSAAERARELDTEAYLREALPLIERVPLAAAVLEHFPIELALQQLHEIGYDSAAALEALRERPPRISSWTKGEERLMRSGMSKHRNDLVLIQE